MLDVVFVDVALHLRHLAFIRQNDHHGGVAFVGQHDDGGVVVGVVIEVETTCPHHHIHLNLCVFVHVEVCLLGMVTIEGFHPLSCTRSIKVMHCSCNICYDFDIFQTGLHNFSWHVCAP